MSAPASGKRPAANASLSEEHQPAKHDKVDLHQLDDTGNDAEDMSQADLVIDEEPASATAANNHRKNYTETPLSFLTCFLREIF